MCWQVFWDTTSVGTEFLLEVFTENATDDTSSNDMDIDGFDNKDIACDVLDAAENLLHESRVVLDPYLYVSHTVFSFDKRTYELMQEDLLGGAVTLEVLKANDVRGLLNLKRWKRMKDDFSLCPVKNGGQCICLKSAPHLKIACIEDWEGIVHAAHYLSDHGIHQGERDTINSMKMQQWCTDLRKHGIPIKFVTDYVTACGCQLHDSYQQDTLGMPRPGKQSKMPSKIMVTEQSFIQQHLVDIMIEHKVRLLLLRSSRRSGPSKWIQEFVCHRGGKAVRRGANKRRLRKSKRCGCPFKVLLEYAQDSNEVKILLYDVHEGHVPGTRDDLYHLPVHPRVIACCTDDLFDVGTCRHVAKMSKSKESFHMQSSSPLDQVVFRFFMIPKEVQMLSYQMRDQGSMTSFLHICA